MAETPMASIAFGERKVTASRSSSTIPSGEVWKSCDKSFGPPVLFRLFASCRAGGRDTKRRLSANF